MKKTETSILAFIILIAGSCLIPFINFNSDQIESEKTEEVAVNVSTNSVSNTTNAIDRTANKPAQNVDWFIQNSNYIWDNWKIK